MKPVTEFLHGIFFRGQTILFPSRLKGSKSTNVINPSTKKHGKDDNGEVNKPQECDQGEKVDDKLRHGNMECSNRTWTQRMSDLIKTLNSFETKSMTRGTECVPFIINDTQIGLVLPEVLRQLHSHPDTFVMVQNPQTNSVRYVTMPANLNDKHKRSMKFNDVMRDWRQRDLFTSLRGWRNENLPIKFAFSSSETLLEAERSACCLFGFRTYGVHVSGYVRHSNGGGSGGGDMYMWIARRSKTKPTYPGQLDNTVGGGISCDESVWGTLVRECEEEAGMSEALSSVAKPGGTISYFLEDERGLHPETQFVFDLELPLSFQPINTDKEVAEYYLLPVHEVKELIATSEFKPNSALVLLDFFIRHGFVDPDTEPNYVSFTQGCRQKLPY